MAAIPSLAVPHLSPELSLAALARYTEARRLARVDCSGVLVPPAEQDPRLWRRDLIEQTETLLREAMNRAPAMSRPLQARPESVWCARRSLQEPAPWLTLYDRLLECVIVPGDACGEQALQIRHSSERRNTVDANRSRRSRNAPRRYHFRKGSASAPPNITRDSSRRAERESAPPPRLTPCVGLAAVQSIKRAKGFVPSSPTLASRELRCQRNASEYTRVRGTTPRRSGPRLGAQ